MVKIDVSKTTTGPLFSGRAHVIMDDLMDDIEEEVAQEGVNLIQGRLDSVLRNPSGFYRSRIRTDRTGGNMMIHDSNVVYGPWLEGTGSRNRTTRFKGYRTFRLVQQDLAQRTKHLVERAVDRAVDRLNG